MKRVMRFLTEHGRARTIVIIILVAAAAVGAFYVGMYLRERQEPAAKRAATPAPALRPGA